MTQLLPSQSEVDVDECPPRVVSVDEEVADSVFSVLSTGTARRLLSELYREPAPMSTLADRTDMSLQNTTYHVQRLADVELVEVVDTWYSSKGREMKVYAPTSDPLVLVAGDDHGDTVASAIPAANQKPTTSSPPDGEQAP